MYKQFQYGTPVDNYSKLTKFIFEQKRLNYYNNSVSMVFSY